MLCFLFIVKLLFFFEMHWSPSQFSNLHSNNHNLAIFLKKKFNHHSSIWRGKRAKGCEGMGTWFEWWGRSFPFQKEKKNILFKSFTTICSFLFSTLSTERRHLLKQSIFSLSLSDFIFWLLPQPFFP